MTDQSESVASTVSTTYFLGLVGEKLTTEYFLDYVTEKYEDLYDL